MKYRVTKPGPCKGLSISMDHQRGNHLERYQMKETGLVRDEEGLITALASPSDPAMERDCCPSFSEEKSEIDGSASCCMLPFSCGTGTWIPLTPSSPKSPLSCDELSLTSFWIRGEKVWSVQVVLALHWKQKG